MRLVVFVVLIVATIGPVFGQEIRKRNEGDFNRAYCSQLNGSIEQKIKQRNSTVRVDCLAGIDNALSGKRTKTL